MPRKILYCTLDASLVGHDFSNSYYSHLQLWAAGKGKRHHQQPRPGAGRSRDTLPPLSHSPAFAQPAAPSGWNCTGSDGECRPPLPSHCIAMPLPGKKGEVRDSSCNISYKIADDLGRADVQVNLTSFDSCHSQDLLVELHQSPVFNVILV